MGEVFRTKKDWDAFAKALERALHSFYLPSRIFARFLREGLLGLKTCRGFVRMISASIELVPRLEETAPIGFVSHESYLPWLEVGRAALLKKYGLDYRKFEQSGFFLPVLELKLTFYRPAFYEDTLTIVTSLLTRPAVRFRLEYSILRDAHVLADGYVIQGFVDRQGRPARPPVFFTNVVRGLFLPS